MVVVVGGGRGSPTSEVLPSQLFRPAFPFRQWVCITSVSSARPLPCSVPFNLPHSAHAVPQALVMVLVALSPLGYSLNAEALDSLLDMLVAQLAGDPQAVAAAPAAEPAATAPATAAAAAAAAQPRASGVGVAVAAVAPPQASKRGSVGGGRGAVVRARAGLVLWIGCHVMGRVVSGRFLV